MKKQFKTRLAGLILLTASLLSCQDHDIPQAVQVFKVGQEPPTVKYADLLSEVNQVVFGSPAAEGLGTDPTGERHSIDKQPRKDVVFLIGTLGGKAERSLVIPKDRYVYVNIYATTYWYYDEDPCDPTFHPAPGQSSLDFLKSVFPDLKKGTTLSVQYDGQELITQANRDEFYVTTPVFPLKVDKDFDYPACDYSAKTSQAYGEGYSMILKLPAGKHTLFVRGTGPQLDGSGIFETEVLWHLTVE